MIRYTSRWLTTTLLISVVLNLALGAILILRAPAPHPAHQSQLAQPATVAAKPAAPQAAPPAPRFHWSQIESEDFSVYVTNLRQIGCPEATIKEIVKSEIAEIYQEKRRGLEMAIQERKEHGTGKATFSALRKELDNLPRIESALVEEVMSTQEQREAAKTLAAGPANVAAEEAAAKTALLKQTVRVPLALRNLYQSSEIGATQSTGMYPSSASITSTAGETGATQTTGLNLAEDHYEAVVAVQQQFVQDMSSTSLPSTDPGYAEQWYDAQISAEERLRSLIGNERYNQMQTQAFIEDEQAKLKNTAP